MAEQLRAPKGVPEYIGAEGREFLAVREALARSARLAGYEYIELPVYEDTNLYVRGVGESTDVVSKEMFTFTDRGERSITLRPEGTAGVMRAVIEHGLDRGQLPVKLWYAGPFFRAERPQAGRYRQLQQVGVEAIGSDDPALDAEVVAIADEGFRSLGLTGFSLKLNSLGCSECRPAYRAQLSAFLAALDLDEATRQRAELNPLRVLDDKREAVQAQLVSAPLQSDRLCRDCEQHYAEVRHYLQLQGVVWQEAPRLVRGLDYYTRTTFEFDHPLLGAQSGIGGGGRYDGLMEDLGGAQLSGIGFGIGTDRTLLACRAEGLSVAAQGRCDVYLIGLGQDALDRQAVLARDLRQSGVSVDSAFGGKGLKGAMKSASRSGARWAVIVGEDDLASGAASVKDLATGEQRRIPFEGLAEELAELSKESTSASHP